MSFKNIKFAIAAAILSLTATSSQAQVPYRLPATHTSQHRDLIASQKPVINPITQNQAVINSVKERESLAEIYNTNWNSPSVNPYGNSAAIPATKQIDVSDFHMPVPSRVTSPFGWRARFGRMHKGVDMSLRMGDTVRAAFNGKVRLTKFEGKGYGYYVVIRHDNGMETVYGHLSRFLVKPNQRVKAGEPIALGGSTGRSTGPHLHFETRYMGIALNPESIIDFNNKTTHREVFTFDRASAERALRSGAHRSTAKLASTTPAKKKSTPAKKKSRRRR